MTAGCGPGGHDPAPLAGRYVLGEEIGRGGGGIVRRATDRLTGETVAVKTVRADARRSVPRVRREAVAMRLLRIPGVVTLRDEILDGDQTHIVMDLVAGTPFPGPLPENVWERIAPRVRALLEVLARVHAAGIVHRDLKPGNVLVDDRDRVTLLDFGASWGAPLGPALTQSDAVVGTPEYLAPEQLRGRGNDPRVDLYAVGVMLYEVLGGRQAFPARSIAELVLQKSAGRLETLEHLAPRLPRPVSETVMSLLAVDPADRPQSARAALRRFFGAADEDPALAPLPRLGSREPLDRIVAAIRARDSIDVHGESGTGRTRLLADASEAARAEGRAVRWVCAGRAPYASVEAVVGPVEGLAAGTRDDARSAIRARIAEILARGDVVFADDPQRIDRWSAEVLAECRGAGSLVRVTAEPTEGCVRTSRVSEAELRPLFAGPSRIFHLPEDAAAELWGRTGGHFGALRSEIAAWIRAGFAAWRDGLLVVERVTLDRLRSGAPVGVEVPAGLHGSMPVSPEFDEILAWVQVAWPHATTERLARASGRPTWIVESILSTLAEDGAVRVLPNGIVLPLAASDTLERWSDDARRAAHRSIADALPKHSLERLRHLAAAGDARAVADEAVEISRPLAADGRTGDALAALHQAIEAALDAHDGAALLAALEQLADTSLLVGTDAALSHAKYQFERTAPEGGRARAAAGLLDAAAGALRTDPAAAVRRLESLGPIANPHLELSRRAWIVRTASRISMDAMAEHVAGFGRWAHATGDAAAVATFDDFEATLCWRRCRFDEAARSYGAVARSHPSGRSRVAALLNLGSVLSASGRHAEARDAARRALELAAERRNPLLEAHAESLLRDVAYALRETNGADLELVRAIEALGNAELTAWAHLRESAAAWRSGDFATAIACARAAEAQGLVASAPGIVLLARCLAIACGDTADAAAVAGLVRDARTIDDTIDGFEALALLSLARADPDGRAGLREALGNVRDRVPGATRGHSATVVTFEEAVGFTARGSG